MKELLQYGGPWLSAIGSISAVVAALLLARRRRVGKPKLSIRKIITGNFSGGSIECIRFGVTNVGEAPVTVTDIGWRVGFPLRRKYLNHDAERAFSAAKASDPIPTEIKTNQTAVIWIPLVHGKHTAAAWIDPVKNEPQGWSDFLASQFDGGPASLWARSVRGWAETSDGRRISARIEKSLRVSLAQTARQSRQQI